MTYQHQSVFEGSNSDKFYNVGLQPNKEKSSSISKNLRVKILAENVREASLRACCIANPRAHHGQPVTLRTMVHSCKLAFVRSKKDRL
jgi:hypothetical protein